MSKKYDIVAITGTYTNGQGEQKNRYQTVGAVLTNDNGPYIALNKTFNPAGLAQPDKDSIFLSLFEPKVREEQPTQQTAPPADDFSDSIPF